MLTPRQELLLGKVVEVYHEAGQPVGSKSLAADVGRRAGARRRSATSSRCSRSTGCSRTRTPPPAACRPTPATATTSTACCRRAARRAAEPAARAVARAPRGRRGDARHDRDALAGHQPAGDRLRAADRDGDDPPRRGPAAAAAGADGRRDHLDRRRHQARCFTFERAGRRRPRRLGRELPERAARRASASARACCTSGSPTRRSAPTSAASSTALAPAFTELAETAEDTLYVDGALAPAVRAPLRGPLAAQRADGDARAPRVAARRAALARSTSATSTCASAARTRRPALRSLALVAANYGLPQRNLGTVSVIGPMRMDYGARDRVRARGRDRAVALRRRRLRD